ncbi:DUF927 domain-containing protein [Sphingomonas sp. XXL09]|uniref:DUF927 domain-containing protein n=1 Tax=Sphingomonas sp. XXL09 TaxID=3457787 RepID=UPI00406BAE04
MFYHDLKVSGLSGSSGKRYIVASYGGITALIPHAECHGNANLLQLLADRNLVLPGAPAAKTLLQRIYDVNDFPVGNVIATPGYADGQFTLGNGVVIGLDARRSQIAFSTDATLFNQAGTLGSWRSEIARHLEGQPIPMMAMLLAFAVPLATITGNSICRSIEFVGAPSSGIRILPLLLAGVSGTPARHVAQFAQLVNGSGGTLSHHNDLALPVVGSDVCLAGESPARRALATKGYLFPSQVEEDDIVHNACRVLFCHEPLLGAGDAITGLASSAADRHISIRIPSERPYGIFERLPKKCPDTAALTRHLSNRVQHHHGVALRRFLDHLVGASSDNLGALQSLVSGHMNTFRTKAAGNRNDLCDAVITDTFALAYAAGEIAKQQGVLPDEWQIGPATMRCYRRYRFQAGAPRPFAELLREISTGDDVVQIGGSKRLIGSLQDANVFVKHLGSTIEVMIRPHAIYALLPDWDRWRRTPSAKKMMVTEKGRLQVKRILVDGSKKRVYCFRMPSPSMEDQPKRNIKQAGGRAKRRGSAIRGQRRD